MLEAADVLNVLGVPGSAGEGVGGSIARSWERPADTLLCKAQDVRVGAAGGAAVGLVALDVGFVCPQAAVHLDNAQANLGIGSRKHTPAPHEIGRRWRRVVGLQG